MASGAAVRTLALLAAAALHGASVFAVPLNAQTVPAVEPSFMGQPHWPAAQWVEPTPFVIAGLSGLEDPAMDERMPHGVDPSDRAARLLAMWIRLAAAAERGDPDLLLELDASLGADQTFLRTPLAVTIESAGGGNTAIIVPATGGTSSWDIGSVSLAATPLPSHTSFDAHVSVPNAKLQSGAMTMDGMPLRSFTPMPWIGLALALLAIGWIGWRTAA